MYFFYTYLSLFLHFLLNDLVEVTCEQHGAQSCVSTTAAVSLLMGTAKTSPGGETAHLL